MTGLEIALIIITLVLLFVDGVQFESIETLEARVDELKSFVDILIDR